MTVNATVLSIQVPAAITAEATSAGGAVVSFTATTTDPTDGVRNATCTPASGTMFALGTTTVTCTGSNTHGATITGSFTVKVVDTTPPALTVPSPSAEATGPAGAVVTYTATAADLVSGSVTPVCTPVSGSTFAVGNTTVTCTASDTRNNSTTRTFVVVCATRSSRCWPCRRR